MNLLMVCVLLLVAFICQPTLIYGLRGSHNSAAAAVPNTHGDHELVHHQRSIKTFGGKVKRSRSHLPHASAAEQANAKLVMEMESGDVLVRRAARGANVEGGDDSASNVDAAAVGGGKRNKNGNNNNNKKLNKSSDASNGGRKQDKKFSAAIGGQAQQQHHGSGNGNANGNGKGRQRQQLRSQQHQGHGKRGGNGNGSGSGAKVRMESVEKTSTSEKSQSSCRYAKGAWTDCDPKTNVRTRTLTLKKGEANCLTTRTMQKKCKKPCRYEKGAWSECTNGQMTRQDKLKSAITTNPTVATDTTDTNADSSCEPMRKITKRCNIGGAKMANKSNKERKHKDKGQRRTQQQAQ
ncbi:putative uncharacterized protein DDB_G0274405 [Bactrocera dorsalis]|uniref:Pleiotrophin/Midkine C-terminal domain-containing protein n=1 Tax=Bactrocera dorsalis TaxID=27457 RepID=A0ABM3JXS2_BACDO|nr:putative uncharacterized protein DDB_G0274405 [Bactrocera dorsalis]XP_049314023.1 putative uncharacterized protein DDB_G0274405 [Bactrocera dorsalis]